MCWFVYLCAVEPKVFFLGGFFFSNWPDALCHSAAWLPVDSICSMYFDAAAVHLHQILTRRVFSEEQSRELILEFCWNMPWHSRGKQEHCVEGPYCSRNVSVWQSQWTLEVRVRVSCHFQWPVGCLYQQSTSGESDCVMRSRHVHLSLHASTLIGWSSSY